MKYLSLFSGIGGFELGIQQAYELLTDRRNTEELSQDVELQSSSNRSDGQRRRTCPTCIGVFTVAETLTDVTDTWATPFRYLIMGDYGSINLYLPSMGMDYEEKSVTAKAGRELYMEQLYNATVWTRMKDRVLTIKVN